jgi:Ser/Thr protein kinase RdoA (MazF antagonist)
VGARAGRHLVTHQVPVARTLDTRDGEVATITLGGREHATALFEWLPGNKPKPERTTYLRVGEAATRIHQATEDFDPTRARDIYDATELIDFQLELMRQPLLDSKQLHRVTDLGQRLNSHLTRPCLDWDICHMDLTLDNVHRSGDTLAVFDFDSAGECWRSIEPYLVLLAAEEKLRWWLEGYRAVRPFSQQNEDAVATFAIIGEIRNVVWKLGLASSSRGEPMMTAADLPEVVDGWLEWERQLLS